LDALPSLDHVLLVRAEVEVFRVDAAVHIALVQNMQLIADLAAIENPSRAI
jgi:hypothetical protein